MEVAALKSLDNAAAVQRESAKVRLSHGRSRITNGSALLPGIDGRSAWVRRAKDVIASHLSDMGGKDNTSAAERSIVRRASVLTVELERLEARFAVAGETAAVDLDLYIRASGNLRRLLESVGLERRSRDVTPSLSEYLARYDGEQATGAPEDEPDEEEMAAEETPTREPTEASA